MSANRDIRPAVDQRHPRDAMVDALLTEEHAGDRSVELAAATARVLARLEAGEAGAAAERADRAAKDVAAPIAMARWTRHLAALLFCSLTIGAWVWFTQETAPPTIHPVAGAPAQDPVPRPAQALPIASLEQLRAMLPLVGDVVLDVRRLPAADLPSSIELGGVPVTADDALRDALLAGLRDDAAVGPPAGWEWSNRLDLVLTDGRRIEMAILPHDRGPRQTLGLRGLDGDLWLTGPSVATARELLETATYVARQAHGVVLSRQDLDGPFAFPTSLPELRLFQLEDADLAALRRFAGLQRLDCTGLQATLAAPGLRHIARCETITDLTLRGCAVDDAGLMLLTDLVHLQRLDLAGARGLTGEGFQFFAASARSRVRPASVRLDAIPTLTDRGLENLSQFLNQPPSIVGPDLGLHVSLRGSGDAIGAAGWRALTDLEALTQLDVSGWPLDAGRVRALTGLTRLQRLTLEGCGMTDAALTELAAATTLQALSLRDNPDLTMAGVEALGALTTLRELDLRGLDLDRDALAVFAFLHESVQVRF